MLLIYVILCGTHKQVFLLLLYWKTTHEPWTQWIDKRHMVSYNFGYIVWQYLCLYRDLLLVAHIYVVTKDKNLIKNNFIQKMLGFKKSPTA